MQLIWQLRYPNGKIFPFSLLILNQFGLVTFGLVTSAVTWRVTFPSEAAHQNFERAQLTLRTRPPPVSLVLPKRKINTKVDFFFPAWVRTSLWRFRKNRTVLWQQLALKTHITFFKLQRAWSLKILEMSVFPFHCARFGGFKSQSNVLHCGPAYPAFFFFLI